METLKLDIVTPEGKIFSNDVKSVTLPGSEGEFGVLPGHIGIVTTLNSGVIEIEKKDGKREIVAINWGYAKVDETSVDVLAEGAVDIMVIARVRLLKLLLMLKNCLKILRIIRLLFLWLFHGLKILQRVYCESSFFQWRLWNHNNSCSCMAFFVFYFCGMGFSVSLYSFICIDKRRKRVLGGFAKG